MMRQGSAPNFCPPIEEGLVLEFEDEEGEKVSLEFLGIILHEKKSYGFFFPIDEDTPVGSSGQVVILEVTEFDDDEQPIGFELMEDEGIAQEVYEAFKEATKDLYDFS